MFANVLCYIMASGGVAALYLIRRPNVSGRDVLHSWLIGTPASIVLNLFLLTPLRYYALFRLRDNR